MKEEYNPLYGEDKISNKKDGTSASLTDSAYNLEIYSKPNWCQRVCCRRK